MNPRQAFERETDNMPVWAKILYKYGVPSAIALFLVWFIAVQLLAAVRDVQASLKRVEEGIHNHAYQTSFYMRAMCINTAVQSGQSTALCDPSVENNR